MLKRCLAALALSFIFMGSVTAGSKEDGWTAYNSGDYASALTLWTPLAEQGDTKFQYILGSMYSDGQGVAKDDVEAVKWYLLAAEQGYAIAQNSLGLSYANGQGVVQDFTEALRLYHLAAEQGYAKAQSNLGVMYARGRGVPEDLVIAYVLFDLAASQGDEKAKENRDMAASGMTQAQIEKAQRLSQECISTHYKNCL